MRIEEEKMWTEANKEDYLYDLMGTLRPNKNVRERETTRVKIRVSEEMYVIMSDTPSTFEVFIHYLEYLISKGEIITSKSGTEFVVKEFHITYDHMTKKQVAEISLISVNRLNLQYKETDKRELLTTLIQSTPH